MRRIGITLIAALFLVVLGLGYILLNPPVLLNEQSIRNTVTARLSEWTGALVSIRGGVRLNYFPRLTLDLENIHLADIQRVPALRDIQAERAIVRLELWSLISGKPVVDRLTLVEPEIESRAVTAPAAGYVAQTQAPALVNLLRAAPFEQIVLENGTLTAKGPRTLERFSDISLKIIFNSATGSHFSKGSFRWRDEPVNFRFSSGAPEVASNLAKIPIDLRIDGSLIKADIKGEAALAGTTRMKGNLNLTIADLPRFSNWLGVLMPDGGKPITFGAEGAFQLQESRIAFDEGSFTIDDNRAIGALALEYSGPRPQVEGTLALQKVDLSQYIRTATGAGRSNSDKAAEKQSDRTFEVDFPLLHHIDFDLRVSTTELAAGAFSFGQTALSFSIRSGRLMADFVILDLCGGNGNGRLEFNAAAPRLLTRLRANLTDLSSSTCLESFMAKSPLGGTTDLTVDLSTRGRTVSKLLEHLGGKVKTTITSGRADIDFAKLVAQARNSPITGWRSVRGRATPFDTLKGEFIFRHGSAYSDTLEVVAGGTRISGEGTIDLLSRSLDLRVAVSSEKPETSPSLQQLMAGLAGSLVIQGPWSGPRITLEPTASSGASDPLQRRGSGDVFLHTLLSSPARSPLGVSP